MKKASELKYGFKNNGSVHTARTIMLEDLMLLLSAIRNTDTTKSDYKDSIITDNCLRKRSIKTRTLSYRHLSDLYSLDPANLLFSSLLYYWNRDPLGRPLLALLCAYSRDSMLRDIAPFILQFLPGEQITRKSLEDQINTIYPDRFSKATLCSVAQNINSSFTKSGHLQGRSKKIRIQATASPGSVSYALLLGYLNGARGQELLHTPYIQLIDCTPSKAVELAEEASRKGWLIFKRIGNVIEALFPKLLNQEDIRLFHE